LLVVQEIEIYFFFSDRLPKYPRRYPHKINATNGTIYAVRCHKSPSTAFDPYWAILDMADIKASGWPHLLSFQPFEWTKQSVKTCPRFKSLEASRIGGLREP
jgi:hypothetical protein